MFEDPKPAGFEAVGVRSGEPLVAHRRGSNDTRSVYTELRDRHVALFMDRVPQGIWEMRYDLRAEVPGEFHALPVVGQAMYVPEIRGNGVETRVEVLESGP